MTENIRLTRPLDITHKAFSLFCLLLRCWLFLVIPALLCLWLAAVHFLTHLSYVSPTDCVYSVDLQWTQRIDTTRAERRAERQRHSFHLVLLLLLFILLSFIYCGFMEWKIFFWISGGAREPTERGQDRETLLEVMFTCHKVFKKKRRKLFYYKQLDWTFFAACRFGWVFLITEKTLIWDKVKK